MTTYIVLDNKMSAHKQNKKFITVVCLNDETIDVLADFLIVSGTSHKRTD